MCEGRDREVPLFFYVMDYNLTFFEQIYPHYLNY